MAESVSRETIITGGKMAAFERRSGKDRLAKIRVGVEEADEAFDLNVVELAGQVRNGVIPANQAVGDNVEAGFHLFGDDGAGHVVLHVEKIGGGAVASVERGNCSAQALQIRGIADARVASRAGKVEARSRAHSDPPIPAVDS